MWHRIDKGLFNKLQIKPAEKSMVLWSFAYAFLIGCVLSWLAAVPMSLFLTRFGSTNLPQVYLSSACLAVCIGWLYSWFERRITFNHLMLGLFVFTLATTTVLWLLLTGAGNGWIIAMLVVWAITAYNLLELGLWSVFNRIYNLQQGKRLYGLISTAQGIGGMLAGLALPLMLVFIATEQILMLTGVFLLLAVLILLRLQQSYKATEADNDEDIISTGTSSIRHILQHPYLVKLLALIVLGVFVMVLVDFLFNSVAEKHYPDKVALAGFLGVFFGLVDGLGLLISAFAFTWFLKRVGLVLSLVLLPALIVTLGVALLVSHVLPLAGVLLFWLIALLKFLEESIRASVNDMSHLLLLQPLSPGLRAYMLAKSDTLVVPLSIVVISCILWALTHLFGIVMLWLILIVLLCVILCIWLVFTLKSDYIKALSEAIGKRYAMSADFQQFNKESLPILQHTLHSPYPDLVIYALSNIEQIDRNEFLKALPALYHAPEHELRQFFLQKILQHRIKTFFPDILLMLDHETDPTVKAQAISVLGELHYAGASIRLAPLIEDANPVVANAAIITLWRYGEPFMKQVLMNKIQAMIIADQDKTRQSAAFIIGEINVASTNLLLANLVSDPAKRVRREALMAAIKTVQIDCLPSVLTHLDLIPLRGDILKRLLRLELHLMPIIEENFANYSPIVKAILLQLMGPMSIVPATTFLENTALTHDDLLRKIALRTLSHRKQHGSQTFHDNLFQHIQAEARYLEKQHDFYTNTPDLAITQLLRDTLWHQIILTVERILLSITIYYRDMPLKHVKTGLLDGSIDDISYAMELLEEILDPEHKNLLLPIMTRIYLTGTQSTNALDSPAFHNVLKTNLQLMDQKNLNTLTCVACLYVIKTIGIKPFEAEITALRNSRSAIIQETLAWLHEDIATT